MAEENNKSLLTKKDIQKCFWRWQRSHIANYNYERMQASGVVWAMSPVLRKLYGNDKEAMTDALQRHLQFFNTEPNFGGPIVSVAIAMEEQKAAGADITGDTIDSVKVGLMGPLAGIGDTLWQGTIIPIVLSFTIPFASQGNIILGPVAFFVCYLLIMRIIAYKLWMMGYNKGKESILKILKGSLLKRVMAFAQTLGPIVMGALTYNFVTISTPLKISLQSTDGLSVQTGILDALIPGLLPLAVTLGTYYLLKRKISTAKIMLIMIVASIVCGGLGIFVGA